MTIRLPWVLIFCFLLPPLPAPAQNAADTPDRMMTEEQAFALLRSANASSPDLGFVTVRRLKATASTRRTAEESLKEARSRHLEPYWDGVLTDLMREGGFVILEVNQRYDTARRLHLVTLDEAGKPLVQSKDIEGDISRSDALALLSMSQELSEAFFASPGPHLRELLRKFGGGHLPVVESRDAEKYSTLPESVIGLATPGQLQDFNILSTTLLLWPVRQAPALPMYAANSAVAVDLAQKDQENLFKQFCRRKGKRPDFIYDLIDFDSISSRDELVLRLQWLREMNSFLEQNCRFCSDSATYKDNIAISTIPLELGVEKDSGRMYDVMTAPGLLSGWIRTESGEFILKVLTRPGE